MPASTAYDDWFFSGHDNWVEYPELPDDRYCEIDFNGDVIDIVVEYGESFPLFFDEHGNHIVEKEYDKDAFKNCIKEFTHNYWDSIKNESPY